MTRAGLMNLPAWADLGTDEDGNPRVWVNFYDCARCGNLWSDEWSCQCDDDCPSCGSSASPSSSDWIGPDDEASRVLWESLLEYTPTTYGATND